jgi:hypothetical protein
LAGLGRKEFNSGDILLASEVQGYLQDQAVMVFDDATARGSAIPSPSEGMLTYNKDTDQLELYDGSAFGPVGSDSGLIHIETVDFSGAAAASFSNDTFTSTFDRFLVLWYITTVTSGTREIAMRLRASGSDVSSAGAYSNQNTGLNTNNSTVTAGTVRTYVRMTFSETTDVTSGNIYLPRTLSEPAKTLFGDTQGDDGSGNKTRGMFGAKVNATTAYDSMSLINIGGTNISGSMSAYGYKK